MSPSACGSTATRATSTEKVEQALRGAALWDEVKDKLHKQRPVALRRPAAAAVHRPGHRHRARSAADGRALLGLDPIATRKIEELMLELKKRFTIAIVTHNLAAGPARRRQDRLPLRRHHARRPHRLPGRIRRRPSRSSTTPGKSTPRITSAASSARSCLASRI